MGAAIQSSANLKAAIINQLKADILHLQGFKSLQATSHNFIELGPLESAFPNSIFPIGAIHELVSAKQEHAAATAGFIAGLLSGLMKQGKACLWISVSRNIYPPSLQAFGVQPDQVIFADLKKEKDLLWVVEESLKCEGLAAVVAEVRQISFSDSRRLQLAVEHSHVTGFLVLNNSRQLNTTASVARWHITPLASESENEMPGLGFPRWNVELLKVRNGKPGSWKLEWAVDRFIPISTADQVPVIALHQRTA